MISDAFKKFKSNLELNETFSKIIESRHNAVRSVVENNGSGVKTQLIGSLQRQTKIQPKEGQIFDIDILVILGNFYSWVPTGGISPQDAMKKLGDIIKESDRYGSMGPVQDQPVITIPYQDNTKVELVPAYLDCIGQSSDGVLHSPKERAYWIPKNGRWVLADYDHEAAHMTSLNTMTDGWFIPVVKMLKSAKREYIPQLGSFHLEVVAGDIIPLTYLQRRQGNLEISYPALITDFFHNAADFLVNPVKVNGSNSPHCYLDSATKNETLQTISNIKNHCNSINNMTSDIAKLKAWRELFGEAFPATLNL